MAGLVIRAFWGGLPLVRLQLLRQDIDGTEAGGDSQLHEQERAQHPVVGALLEGLANESILDACENQVSHKERTGKWSRL